MGGVSRAAAAWGGRYTFLSVERSELDRNLAPSQMRFAAQHMMRPLDGWGLNRDACSRIVILSVVHVLQTFQFGCIVVGMHWHWMSRGMLCSLTAQIDQHNRGGKGEDQDCHV